MGKGRSTFVAYFIAEGGQTILRHYVSSNVSGVRDACFAGLIERQSVALGVVVLAAVFVLAGCSPSTDTLTAGLNGTGAVAATTSPKLESADKIRVTVFNEPQLSGEYTVDGAGSIAYPLVGQVPVAGLDAQGVEKKLHSVLNGRYLVNPKISVEVVSVRPIYILGEVNRPGEIPYRPGVNALTAIALAGGFSPRASTGQIRIQRANDKEIRSYPVDPTILINPGDVIHVSERIF